jgi:4-hydroxy-3-methylbut-2-en-1-yl diphosphate synthase IspG/GcpE
MHVITSNITQVTKSNKNPILITIQSKLNQVYKLKTTGAQLNPTSYQINNEIKKLKKIKTVAIMLDASLPK